MYRLFALLRPTSLKAATVAGHDEAFIRKKLVGWQVIWINGSCEKLAEHHHQSQVIQMPELVQAQLAGAVDEDQRGRTPHPITTHGCWNRVARYPDIHPTHGQSCGFVKPVWFRLERPLGVDT
jgi:hypothetical protein